MDPFITPLLLAGGSLASGIGGYLGSREQAGGALAAGGQNAAMQQLGLQQLQQIFDRAMGNFSPFISSGKDNLNALNGYLRGGANAIGGGGDSLISNFALTPEQLEKTPGYQFVRDQGLKAVQNSMTAKGLGLSGNAVQAGIDYAENLANTTWKDVLNAYLMQNRQAYDMLFGPASLGANAAGAAGGVAANMGNSIGQMYGNIGNALAGGTMGAANATASGINSLFGGIGGGLAMGGMYGNNPLAGNSSLPSFVTGGLGTNYSVPTF